MFRNYLKIAQRNILKRKVFSLINIVGLSVSIAVSILILLYAVHELSYDSYYDNVDAKYRVVSHVIHGEEEYTNNVSNGTLAGDILEIIPGVKNAFQVYIDFPYVQVGNETYLEDNYDVYYAGDGIFDFFSVKFTEGNPETALKEPFSIVLTETYAHKYFGDSLVLGKSLLVNSKLEYKVTGVVKDLPENTHFKFNILFSLPSLLKTYGLNDYHPFRNSFITYVEFSHNENIEQVEKKITEISLSYLPPQLKEMITVWKTLQPIKDIHLKSDFEDKYKGGNIKIIYIFSSIAILILLLACINYINLSTAQYSSRTKEVAIRKTTGANRSSLVKQFITESVIIILLSLATAIVIAEFFLPIFNTIINFQLKIAYFEKWYNVLLILGVGFLVSLISSLYPAFYLSSFKVVDVFKMKIRIGKGNINIRRVLVVFQFTVTVFLIISTLIISKQLNYVNNKDLGFNKNNLMTVRLNNKQAISQLEVLKNEIENLSCVHSSTVSSNFPSGTASWENIFEFEGHESEQFDVMPLLDVDYNFLETMQISLSRGRNFSTEFFTDSNAVLVNETLVKLMNWKEPIGKKIIERVEDKTYTYHVIGIFRDYHKESLHSAVKPMMLRLAQRKRYLLVRLTHDFSEENIQEIKAVWDKFCPGKPFQNIFIDDAFDRLYQSERNLSNIFIYFSVIAIIIACLGLLGLITLFTQQKTKEISIRKILGAKASNITLILTKEFIILQLIANVIAMPVAYFAMNKWLAGFTFHVKIGWLVFVLGAVITAIISIAAISIQTYKAAVSNPSENLRYE